MHTGIFRDGENFLAGPDEIRYLHWTLRGTFWPEVGPTRPLLQHDFQKIYAKKNRSERGKVVLANHRVG